jgi:hypothetical protein
VGRLSALYSGLAAAVASEAGRGGRPVVLSGDCMAPGGPSPAQVTGALSALLGMGRVAAVGVACTWYPGHSAAERIRQHLGAALA